MNSTWRRHLTLVAMCIAQGMILLDITIVNALPALRGRMRRVPPLRVVGRVRLRRASSTGPSVSTLSVSGCRLRCRLRRWAAVPRRASSVAVRDARQGWWRCGRGSRQRSSCRRGRSRGSVCADGPPSGGRQRASGCSGVVAEADRHSAEDLAVRAHWVAADRTEEPGELQRGVAVHTGPDSFARGGDVVDLPSARVDAGVDATKERNERWTSPPQDRRDYRA